MSAPGEPKVAPAPSPLVTLAREAADAISALCEAQADARRDYMDLTKLDAADEARIVAKEAMGRLKIGITWAKAPNMREVELRRMTTAIALGIVAPAWAIRVVTIATEVGGG